MRDQLSTLQDPDDSSLTLEVAIFGNADVRFFVFLLGFFELDLVDFDAVFGVLEVGVHAEGVGFVDVFASGMFCERSKFGAGERLEGSFYFRFSCRIVSIAPQV